MFNRATVSKDLTALESITNLRYWLQLQLWRQLQLLPKHLIRPPRDGAASFAPIIAGFACG